MKLTERLLLRRASRDARTQPTAGMEAGAPEQALQAAQTLPQLLLEERREGQDPRVPGQPAPWFTQCGGHHCPVTWRAQPLPTLTPTPSSCPRSFRLDGRCHPYPGHASCLLPTSQASSLGWSPSPLMTQRSVLDPSSQSPPAFCTPPVRLAPGCAPALAAELRLVGKVPRAMKAELRQKERRGARRASLSSCLPSCGPCPGALLSS